MVILVMLLQGSFSKAFFTAHMAHLDMLRTVSLLAREATRRTAAMTNALTASSHACTIPMNGIKVANVGDHASEITLMFVFRRLF